MFFIKTQSLHGKNIIPIYSYHPIFVSFSVLGLALSLVGFMHGTLHGMALLLLFFCLILVPLIRWWGELFFEFSMYQRKITIENGQLVLLFEPANLIRYIRDFIKGTKVAMILFIVSEIMFFFSFFWAFFHSLGSPAIQIGAVWPPYGLLHTMPNPLLIPLANTLILLTSGITVTWAHFLLLPGHVYQTKTKFSGPDVNVFWNFILSMTCTIFLAVNFLAWQGYEFIFNGVQMSDGIFGSTFYILTGFHGMHVLIGTIFLTIFLLQTGFELIRGYNLFNPFNLRQLQLTMLLLTTVISSPGPGIRPSIKVPKFSKIKIKYIPSVGFDCAVWYWHFVDIVWLLLFSFVYLPDYFISRSTELYNVYDDTSLYILDYPFGVPLKIIKY